MLLYTERLQASAESRYDFMLLSCLTTHRILIALQLTCSALERSEACRTAYRIRIGENYEAINSTSLI